MTCTMKELVIPLFGADRTLGTFPTRVHSDLRHLVEMLRRGKQPRLAPERLAALEEALQQRKTADGALTSIAELRAHIETWRSEGRAAFDAESYYDKARTVGYTEHNRGSQDDLSRRALQLCAIDTRSSSSATDELRKGFLAVDLGCGSGLSTAAAVKLPGYAAGVIGIDLSSEMLKSEAWDELACLRCPLAGERLRCDLAQPLPFRAGMFDVAYSVAAVHYLAQDTLHRKAGERLDNLLRSLRRSLAARARPCTLQAFFTKEPTAVRQFVEASARVGWALCDLVVDRASGGSGADRDFLYLVSEPPPCMGPSRPARCPLHRTIGATCVLALEDWAESRGVPPPLVDASHREWLAREHERFAKRLLRLQERCQSAIDSGTPLVLDHAAPPDKGDGALARRLAVLLKEGAGDAEGEAADLQGKIIAALHAEPPAES